MLALLERILLKEILEVKRLLGNYFILVLITKLSLIP
jgi:hypothetical protein